MADENDTLGKYLKQHRESRNISLKEVAKHTRIRELFLRAIEEDRFDLLPSSTYAKSFLLTYAKYFKLDSNDILLRYERSLKGETLSSPPARFPEPKPKNIWRTKRTWMITGIIAVCFLSYFIFLYPKESSVEPVSEKPVSQKTIIEDKLPITLLPPSAPLQAVTPPAASGKTFSLEIKSLEMVWVSLQADDQPVREITFKPGESISVQASRSIHMKVGNAGGLALVLNGKPIEKLGKSGEVAAFVITSQGVEVKRPENTAPTGPQ